MPLWLKRSLFLLVVGAAAWIEGTSPRETLQGVGGVLLMCKRLEFYGIPRSEFYQFEKETDDENEPPS